MSGKLKHMARSRRSHRNTIPMFQQFASRGKLHTVFEHEKLSFVEYIASLFALLRRVGRR